MLKMLMKYEWKYIHRKFLLFAGMLIVATVIGLISCAAFADMGATGDIFSLITGMLGFMLYYTVLIGASIGFTIIVAIRFYRSVFGSAGYVTNTLPVSGRQIYGAHLIVYGLCTFAIALLEVVSIMWVLDRLFQGMFATMQTQGIDPAMMESAMAQAMGLSGTGQNVVMIFYSAIGTICSLLMIYASVVLGQYWKRHKVWGGVVSYIIMNASMVVISFAIIVPYILRSVLNGIDPTRESVIGPAFWVITLVITLVYGVVSFVIMDRGMMKRLNLE